MGDSIKPYSITIEHIGGTNDGISHLDSRQNTHKTFKRDADGNTAQPPVEFETYRRVRILGQDVFAHEDLQTPGPVMEAIRRRQNRKISYCAVEAMRRAYEERIFLEHMTPLNEIAAWYLVSIVEGQVRSNEWATIPREEFYDLISWKTDLGLKGLFGSIPLGSGRMYAWWYPPWFERDTNPDKAQLDHALIAEFTKDGEVTFLARISAFEHWPPPKR